MSDKKRILFCNEASFLCSGYGKYGKEVLTRLHNTGKYDIAEFATYGTIQDPRASSIPWDYYANAVTDRDSRFSEYQRNPSNQFGEWRFERVALDFKPNIVWDIRDFWMLNYQANSPLKDYFHWSIMPTVDSAPQRPEWLEIFSRADSVFTYSDWSYDVLEKEGAGTLNLVSSASPGVDTEIFAPVKNKTAHKASMGLQEDVKIIGTVMRNQKRKLYPDLFAAFRDYLDECERQGKSEQASKTYLYCHTSYPDVGWDFPTLLKEFGLGNKVLFTYVCKQTGNCFPSFFRGAQAVSPFTKAYTAVFPSVSSGITDEQLADIYNLFDVHVQYAICEGFGMPQVEAASCGVPVMAVDYSAMTDVVRKINGYPIKVKRLFRELETGAYRAMPDNSDLVSSLIHFFASPQPVRQRKGIKAREGVFEHYTWDKTAKVWEDHFDSIEFKRTQNKWDSPPRPAPANFNIQNIDNNSHYVEVAINQTIGPERENTFRKSEYIKDLNHKARFDGRGWKHFDREKFVNILKVHCQNINNCESARCGQIQMEFPDYIQFAHARRNQ